MYPGVAWRLQGSTYRRGDCPMATVERRYTRLRLNMRVRLHGMYMLTNDVSFTGAQLSCPAMKFDIIRHKLAGATELPIELHAGDDRIPVVGRLMYASDYGDEYLLGVSFMKFPGDGQARLESFLLTEAGPEALAHVLSEAAE